MIKLTARNDQFFFYSLPNVPSCSSHRHYGKVAVAFELDVLANDG